MAGVDDDVCLLQYSWSETLHACTALVNGIGTSRLRRRRREAVRSLGWAACSWFISGALFHASRLRVSQWLPAGVSRAAGWFPRRRLPRVSRVLRTCPDEPHAGSTTLLPCTHTRRVHGPCCSGGLSLLRAPRCWDFPLDSHNSSISSLTPRKVYEGSFPHCDHIPVSSQTSSYVFAAG